MASKRRGSARPTTPSDAPQLFRGHALAGAIISGAGLLLSLWAAFLYLNDDPAWGPICFSDAAADCTEVLRGSHGTLAGVPLSVFGVWFYAGTLLLSLLGRRPRRLPRSPALILFLAGLVATGTSLVLGFISVTSIGAVCPACAALYLVGAGLLFVGWLALRRTSEGLSQALNAEAHRWRRRGARVVGVSIGALGTLAVLILLFNLSFEASSRICDAIAPRGGAPSPAPRVVVYADFQCPGCVRVNASLRPLRGKLDITQRHYPIDSECNPRVEHSRYPGACLQARAAICAGMQGQYDRFSDRLFETQAIGRTALLELAASMRLERATFDACLESDAARRALSNSVNSAIDDDVHSTPTVFVNGVRHTGGLSPKDLACLTASVQAEHAVRR